MTEFENQLLEVLREISHSLKAIGAKQIRRREITEAHRKAGRASAASRLSRYGTSEPLTGTELCTGSEGGVGAIRPLGISSLIGTYVSHWQERYKTKARPEVGKCVGIFRQLLREKSPSELSELIQVYCQMEDPWFKTKGHDIATFHANISKVALARDKGREEGPKTWQELAKEEGTL